jgi:hypothetical protein
MRSALAAVTLTLASAAAHGQPLEFKGVPFGSTEEHMRQSIPNLWMWDCSDDTTPGRRLCVFAGFTYANSQALGSTAYFDNDKLSMVVVNIPSAGFEDAVLAISDKYGKPRSLKRSKIQNRMGANFDQLQAEWVPNKESLVFARRYADTVDASSIVLATKRALAVDAAQTQRKRSKGDI